MELHEAIAAFERGDVSVEQALAHLGPTIDRRRLLDLRLAGSEASAREALTLVAPLQSAMALEHFVAAPLARAGAAARALEVRLEALAICPHWDSWLAWLLLTRVAEQLLDLRRVDDAIACAERALRFVPADGLASGVLARAYAAAGRDEDAAAVRAWMFDAGFGPYVLAGSPTSADLAATPRLPSAAGLEPMTEEELARHLVFTYLDITLARHLDQGRRHAAALLRCGELAAAVITLRGYAGGSPARSDVASWMNVEGIRNTVFTSTDELLAAAEREAVARGVTIDKKLDHGLSAVRADRGEELLRSGKNAAGRAILFDHVAHVRHRARTLLADDPLVRRAAAIEASIPGCGGMFTGDLHPRDVSEAQHHRGSAVAETAFGVFPEPPFAATPSGPPMPSDDWVPRIERTTDARAKCKACKQPFDVGVLRLKVLQKSFPVEITRYHLGCAVGPRTREVLAAALASTRLAIPDRPALEAALAPTKKTAKPRATVAK